DQGFIGVGGGRFFINGVDTETEGVDIVMSYPLVLDRAGRLDLTFTANFNSTDVTRTPTTAELAALDPAPVLFERVNVLTFEEGSPESRVARTATWSRDRRAATLRATAYGAARSRGCGGGLRAPGINHAAPSRTRLGESEGCSAITES